MTMRRFLAGLACLGFGAGVVMPIVVPSAGAAPPATVIYLVSGSLVPPAGDLQVKGRLETMGSVVVVDDDTVTAGAVSDGALVVLSSSVVLTKVGAKLADVDVPLLSWEALLHDDNKLATNVGETATTSRKIKMTAAGTSQLGLGGEPLVYSSVSKLSYGTVPATAVKLANVVGTPHRATMFWYDDGALRTDGTPAPQCRAGFFADYAGAAKLTPAGVALLEMLVLDLLACNVPSDSDADGLLDAEEAANGCIVGDADTDDDTLTDGEEVNVHGSDCDDNDTDNDGLNDYDDVDNGCDATEQDSDGDGLFDYYEIEYFDSYCDDADTDDDGLDDGDEFSYDTSPYDPDTDGDRLEDGPEVHTHLTDPDNSDTDFGGVDDGTEVLDDLTDPNDPSDDVLTCRVAANPEC